ncbi:MAG TPA: PorP/SprF family type IX secretion system membrane protein [Bacteroidia bacterium]|nr:PorP/SprF family type IX secretion system membrane protein [Bacteroidia bacterium]
MRAPFYKNGLLALLLAIASSAAAQDIHYSQFNASPQNLTPAQTGLFDGDWRFVGNYRSQWSAIPVPYKTFSLAADTRFSKLLKKDVPAAGLVINTDKAGDSKFTTLQVLASLAYIKKLTADSTNFLSLSIQPGFTTKSFDINALTFDNQYNGDVYDKNLASGENFAKTRISYFELGGGLAYLWRKSARKQINIGVSAQHLTQPKQSFFNNSEIELDIKTTVSGLAQFPIAEKIDVIPTFMYQKQWKFNETLIGAFGKYYLKPIDGKTTAVALGAFYRMKDAFILVANMDYKNFNLGVSYDVNTSRLIAATNRRGAFELSVIYIFKKEPVFIAKKRICPIFM